VACQETKISRDKIFDKRFRSPDAEISIGRTAGSKNRKQWQKLGIL
jgi:hypothetical protein